MKKTYFYFLLILLASCVSSKKIQKAKEELSKNTTATTVQSMPLMAERPSVVAIKSRYLLKDSSQVKIFLEVDIENLKQNQLAEQLNDNFRFSWLLQPDYGVRERLATGKIEINNQNIVYKDNKLFLDFFIPRPKNIEKGLLLIEIYQLEDNKKYNNDVSIDFRGTRLGDRFAIYSHKDLSSPIAKNYVSNNDTFLIKSIENHARDLYLLRYKNDFLPAQSPMATNIRPSSSLVLEETIKIQTNVPIKLDKEGIYVAVEDTNIRQNGLAFLLVDSRFPRLTRPENLVRPLTYMSTSQEIKAINENTNPKQAIDYYFLNMTGGNQLMAKKIIKNYYKRIEEANRLFTSFKEGWKTDKGMIYTVLGPPNKVQRSRDREVWLYAQSQNSSEIIFTFNKKPNQFTDNYYELVRYPEYQSYWYPFVEAWRTGKIVE